MTRDEAIQKIQKLLKLSESANAHEAALAASLAQNLMTRFQIEYVAVNDNGAEAPSEPIEYHPLVGTGRLESWRSVLFNVLCDVNGCRAVKTRKNESSVLVCIGRKSAAQTVRYMYEALSRVIEDLCRTHAYGNGRSYAASFKLGANAAICDSLRKAAADAKAEAYREAAATANPHALVRVDRAMTRLKREEDELGEFVAKLGLRGGKSVQAKSHDGYNDGKREGAKVDVGNSRARPLTSGAAQIRG